MTMPYTRIISNPRLIQGLTGLTVEEFNLLLPDFLDQLAQFRKGWRNAIDPKDRQRSGGGGKAFIMTSDHNKLLYILFYIRIYPTLLMQGLLFGHSEGAACEWVGKLLPVLEASLNKKNLKPIRLRGRNVEEILRDFPELKELGLLVDGTERPIRRPKDKEKQKKNFSGKKKRHTTKILTFVNPKDQRIVGVSSDNPGSTHDKKILDEQDIEITSKGEDLEMLADRGFIGAKIPGIKIKTPYRIKRHKKGEPKNKLTKKQKKENTEQASNRIAIEHSNSGFKRSRAASDILRSIKEGRGSTFTIIAMSLHNLRVENRSSYNKLITT